MIVEIGPAGAAIIDFAAVGNAWIYPIAPPRLAKLGSESMLEAAVPPTHKSTETHYVYILTMNDQDKVERMCKVWNAPWALRELGWM